MYSDHVKLKSIRKSARNQIGNGQFSVHCQQRSGKKLFVVDLKGLHLNGAFSRRQLHNTVFVKTSHCKRLIVLSDAVDRNNRLKSPWAIERKHSMLGSISCAQLQSLITLMFKSNMRL